MCLRRLLNCNCGHRFSPAGEKNYRGTENAPECVSSWGSTPYREDWQAVLRVPRYRPTEDAIMNKPAYEQPVVEVLTARELLETIGIANCKSGKGGGGGNGQGQNQQ
jgi:hypothetical protein